jgi:hypothetical protein
MKSQNTRPNFKIGSSGKVVFDGQQKIAECQFCNTHRFYVMNMTNMMYKVVCDCGANGRIATDPFKALEYWNMVMQPWDR